MSLVLTGRLAAARSAAGGAQALWLGVDTEWGDGPHRGPSVVQLALHDQAWVIDTLPRPPEEEGILEAAGYDGALREALLGVFASEGVACLGWSFAHDVARLKGLLGPTLRFARLVDLQPIAAQRGGGGKSHMPSLASCCRAVLGASLDKRQQCSDWDCRPLSSEQLDYAALDAHVLASLREELDVV